MRRHSQHLNNQKDTAGVQCSLVLLDTQLHKIQPKIKKERVGADWCDYRWQR